MFHVILYQPEIPPNTGNIIRLCANSGAYLHLIRPLGFSIDEKTVRRAGMDYAELARVQLWDSLDECLTATRAPRWFAITTRGTRTYSDISFAAGDALVFGPETRGLPVTVLERCAANCRLRIPMYPGNRSLNLNNAVAIVVYEAWRQSDFTLPVSTSGP
jgi:tRNA (cytidine/uridine-2'-O-)-methyltransferase